ncbi:sugar 3,4-ketoisomerase [Halocynthiibacter styelae]|uniref:FdtA/QdtA family cupin domain-containing protein n=1 Tax=Halocynthiibacter styelae TaxID=2761955 RepID=A0A8J7IKT5_9RHOB|nr:FdtA/QdtA family cupin domain-containing protein [Paenihalocynthiibacter styelae]MBI1494978.1 FdtA/QdtA family cupin domain-containing protein [Paenihalocynthiibacter styelae]
MRRSIEECRLIDLPKFSDPRGSLSFVQKGEHLPFDIQRVYYLYDAPDDVSRGLHAHKELEQLIIAISGSFTITINDGNAKKKIRLTRPDQGLYMCPRIWRELTEFSSDAVCLVLASHPYDPDDYIFDIEEL